MGPSADRAQGRVAAGRSLVEEGNHTASTGSLARPRKVAVGPYGFPDPKTLYPTPNLLVRGVLDALRRERVKEIPQLVSPAGPEPQGLWCSGLARAVS